MFLILYVALLGIATLSWLIGWLVVVPFWTWQTMQWWNQRQTLRLSQTAEEIRDHLLQDTFALRRSLELAVLNGDTISEQQGHDWITSLEAFYQSLAQIGNQLSPSHCEENLALAIQHLLEEWRGHPQLTITLDLPATWHREPFTRSRTILSILRELLTLVLPQNATVAGIHVQLVAIEQAQPIGELTVQVDYGDADTVATSIQLADRVEDLKQLYRAFRVLTGGRCTQQQHNQTAIWCFRWQLA